MKETYGIHEVVSEIAKTLRKHMEEHEAALVELYKAHPELDKVSPPGHKEEVEAIKTKLHSEGVGKERAAKLAFGHAWNAHKEHGAHGGGKAEAPKSPVFHSHPAGDKIPKSVSHTHPMDTKKADPCQKCGMAKCMGKCDMSDVKPEVAKASCEKCGKAECACEKSMSKSEFDELAAFVNTVSLYKGEDKNINTGNEKMSSLADKAQGGKGPAKTGSTEEVSEGSGSGGDVLKGKKLGKALSIPSAKPKVPSIPKAPAAAPKAPAAAGPAGTKGDEPAKKSVHNIF